MEIKDCLTAARELDKPLPGYLAPGAAVIALILLEMQSAGDSVGFHKVMRSVLMTVPRRCVHMTSEGDFWGLGALPKHAHFFRDRGNAVALQEV